MALWIKTSDGSLEKAAGSDLNALPLTGGTITGNLQVDGHFALPNARSAEPTNSAPPNAHITEDGNVTFTDYSISDDYLPLSGGTLTGALTVDRSLTLASETSNPLMTVNKAGSRVGYFGVPGAQAAENGELWLRGDKELILQGVDGVRVHQSDLQVDGQIKGPQGTQTKPTFTSENDPTSGFYAGNFNAQPSAAISVDGIWRVSVVANKTQITNDLQVDGTINGTLAFGIADGIDTRDVLERAETAVMPAVDDEGVTTTDADIESVTVNEVVTALLVKVKELSARIEELEGA